MIAIEIRVVPTPIEGRSRFFCDFRAPDIEKHFLSEDFSDDDQPAKIAAHNKLVRTAAEAWEPYLIGKARKRAL